MKKNFIYAALALGAVMGATSCSSEDVPTPADGRGVSFTVNLPAELNTRAYGDGLSATTLYYAVYESGKTNPDGSFTALTLDDAAENPALGKKQFVDRTTTVTLDLPLGKEYDIVFFAANEGSPYAIDLAHQTFTVDFAKMNEINQSNPSTNYDKNDCFVRGVKNFSITGPSTKTVVLYRPVAQLNIGTSDISAALKGNLDYTTTKVEIKNVYNTFNLLAGTVDSDGLVMGDVVADKVEENVALTEWMINPKNQPFPYEPKTYKYLTMQYLLVPSAKTLYNVTFSLPNESGYPAYTFNNVPMQRNHRTNIYGRLLTAPADFNVRIDQFFDGPMYNYPENVYTVEDLTENLQNGTPVTLMNDLTLDALPVDETKGATIDLNGKTLTVNNMVNVEGIVTIKNGTYATGSSIAFNMKDTGVLNLSGVKTHAESTVVLIEPENADWTGSVNIEKSELTGRDYCVSTNAKHAAEFVGKMLNYNINLTNTTMTGCETPLLVNVPLHVNVNTCTLEGSWQGMVMRGGHADMINSEIKTTCTEQANDVAQGQGNQVPRAALTVLNGGAYKYDSTVTATLCSFTGNDNVPSVYALNNYVNIPLLAQVETKHCTFTGLAPVGPVIRR